MLFRSQLDAGDGYRAEDGEGHQLAAGNAEQLGTDQKKNEQQPDEGEPDAQLGQRRRGVPPLEEYFDPVSAGRVTHRGGQDQQVARPWPSPGGQMGSRGDAPDDSTGLAPSELKSASVRWDFLPQWRYRIVRETS